ncbi:type II secretion system protein [Geminisphaera colitermitum]|uniref:type II secretion system protein n=1 Tax=Geminisphaera colitermitum TaxID=1148786 RepID=UPI000158CEE5|nr:prepilin-type N-terminal cleavage/methylation domain-containing protein [Geminisphaera colitermitum]
MKHTQKTFPWTFAVRRRNRRAAFTLIELLTVIVIIGILAAIILPVASKVRESAKIAKGTSNLRQIGTALTLYAANNRDLLPYSYRSNAGGQNTIFALSLSGYLDNTRQTYHGSDSSLNHYNDVFKDPSATVPGGQIHYSAHPVLMPSVSGDPPGTPQVKLSSITDPARQVIIMDASQSAGGSAGASAGKVNKITERLANFTGNLDDPVPAGPNKDNDTQGYIRWRVRGNNAAKFLFVDGHVAVLKIGELKYRHIIAE